MNIRNCIKDLKPYIPGTLKDGAIKLASNENPLGISPVAQKAIMESAGSVSLYPDGGCIKLKHALAEKHSLSPDNFIVGNGSDEVLVLITGAYIEADSNAVTSESTFSEYTFATKLFGGQMRYAPMRNGCFQLEKIASLIDKKTKIVFLCNPNNPTGTYFNEASLQNFINTIPDTTLIVLDEAYLEYTTVNDFPKSIDLISDRNNVIILRTFSKIYGLAGLRVGYGISNPSIIVDLNKTREPFNVNSLAQAAAYAALQDTEFVNQSRELNEKGKLFLYKEFEALGLPYFPTQANFIATDIGMECVSAFERLMELGVTIRPLKNFGLNESIRVTISTHEQNSLFINCLKKVIRSGTL